MRYPQRFTYGVKRFILITMIINGVETCPMGRPSRSPKGWNPFTTWAILKLFQNLKPTE
jgi:hypothetical protein